MEASSISRYVRVVVVIMLEVGHTLPVWAQQDGPSNPPDSIILDHRGYRGKLGTFGVLAAAGIVVPAGVISVVYLIFARCCTKRRELAPHSNRPYDDPDYLGPSDAEEAMEVEELYLDANGGFNGEGESISLAVMGPERGGHGSTCTGSMHELSLIRFGSCSGSFGDTDGSSVALSETDSRGYAQAQEAGETQGNGVNISGQLTVNSNLNDNPNICSEVENEYTMSERSSDIGVCGPTACFKEAVNTRVVSEVHVQLRLTSEGEDSPVEATQGSENTVGGERYVTEAHLYLKGVY